MTYKILITTKIIIGSTATSVHTLCVEFDDKDSATFAAIKINQMQRSKGFSNTEQEAMCLFDTNDRF